jgi:hypothetical protein
VVDVALVAAVVVAPAAVVLTAWLVVVAAVVAGTVLLAVVTVVAAPPPHAARSVDPVKLAPQPTRARSSCRRVAGRDDWLDMGHSFRGP